MPSEVNDGGNAFPFWRYDPEGDEEPGRPTLIWRGMSLRDYFAAKVMQAMVSCHRKTNRDTRTNVNGGTWDFTEPSLDGILDSDDASVDVIAETAYAIADAMLAARSKGGEA